MVLNKGRGEIEVRVRRPEARRVFLAGDFNNWDRSAMAMKRTQGGDWVCRLSLPGGVYQFKYWVDDAWYVENTSRTADAFPFGCNSLIVKDAEAPAVPVD